MFSTKDPSTRSQFTRLKRQLLELSGQLLRKSRTDSRWFDDLGEFWAYDPATNGITQRWIDLDQLEAELAGRVS